MARGMTKLKKLALNGIITRKIMVVPCMVNIWLKVSALTKVLSGTESCNRMIPASIPPNSRKMKAVTP